MDGYPRDKFVREYVNCMDEGVAAFFCGAGTSIPVAMKDWRSLLRDIAEDLGLKVEYVSDLVELAQFNFNERNSRNEIHRLIVDEYARRAEMGELHRHMVRLPIDTIWTTNYDRVIEGAYEANGMRPDVKTTAASLAVHPRLWDVQLFKMHGDVGSPDHCVLTKADYDEYPLDQRGRTFLAALEVQLLSRTFLFLGFSFSDPNIDYVLGHLSVMHRREQRTHYTIMKRPPTPGADSSDRVIHDYRLAQLRMRDWKARFNIETILIDDYDDIPLVLSELVRASHRNHIFVSGAIEDYSSISKDRLSALTTSLGRRLAREQKFIVSGYGLNIGADVIQEYFAEAYAHEPRDLTDRAVIRPFPQRLAGDGSDRATHWTRHRRDMLGKVGFAIFLAGNKVVDGRVLPSDGMIEEFELAKDFRVFPIPIGATGDIALRIWDDVVANPAAFYGSTDVTNELQVLRDESASIDSIVDSVFAMMRKVEA